MDDAGGRDACERRGECIAIEHVDDDGHRARRFERGGALGTARAAVDGVAGIDEKRHERRADDAGRAGEKYPIHVASPALKSASPQARRYLLSQSIVRFQASSAAA